MMFFLLLCIAALLVWAIVESCDSHAYRNLWLDASDQRNNAWAEWEHWKGVAEAAQAEAANWKRVAVASQADEARARDRLQKLGASLKALSAAAQLEGQ